MKGGLLGTFGTAVVGGFAAYLVAYFYENPKASLSETYRRLSEQLHVPTGNRTSGSITTAPGACTIERLFAEVPVPGMHLACLVRSDHDVVATIYLDGQNRTKKQLSLSSPDWASLTKTLESSLGLDLDSRRAKRTDPRAFSTEQPWAMFDAQGVPITALEQLGNGPNNVLIFEGGSFIWPGVRVGHTTIVERVQGLGRLAMRTVSMQPLVFSVDGFLYDSECDYIRRAASPHMAQSGVTLMDHDRGKEATDWRTSSTYFMHSEGHAPLTNVDKRVSDLTRKPISHQEHVQVLRYEHTQRYDVHSDYFDPRLYAADQSTLEMTDQGRRNRMITVLWYLSDVEAGGETIFPRAGNLPEMHEKRDCDKMGGIRVPPKQGRVIMFYSIKPNGDLDELSAHASCAVKTGIKWAANKWIWNRNIRGVLI